MRAPMCTCAGRHDCWCVYVCVEAKDWCFPQDKVSLNPKLGIQIECLLQTQQILLFLSFHSCDFRVSLLHPAFMWVLGIKLRLPHVSSKLFTDWSTFSAPPFVFSNGVHPNRFKVGRYSLSVTSDIEYLFTGLLAICEIWRTTWPSQTSVSLSIE